MKRLTTFLLNGEKESTESIDFIKYNPKTFQKELEKVDTRYVNFIKDLENTADDYFPEITKVCETNFDVCFVNYTIEIDGKVMATEQIEAPEIQKKPYAGDYIWSYIWKKEKLLEFIHSKDQSDEYIDTLFKYVNYIEKPLYHHKPSKRIVFDLPYTDEKEEVRRKNVLYMGNFCNGQFNGYITWINNLGRCFKDEYPITILVDKIFEPTKKAFERYFEVMERKINVNYICDRLITTYSTYYYDKNILTKDQSYMFIHGNMCDYPNSRKYKYDNYDHYVGVSKISAEKAEGYFPTDHYEHIINPIMIDQEEVKPHLRLVSALRNDPIKKIERVHMISQILDEENIPYTWNIFIDTLPYEDKVYGGVIYRRSIQNVLPYIKDADYFVQLSDSEACSYSVLEALSLNTKVILTPLECYEEMNMDDTQGCVIPFECFEKNNKERLRAIVKEIYKNKDNPMQNKLSKEMYAGYKDIFIK